MKRNILSVVFLIGSVLLVLPSVVAQEAVTCEPGFRLFEHELLVSDPVCIPENPARIAALDRFSFETMLALDIDPVAASSFALSLTRDLPYLEERVADVIDLGQPPNIELLLDAQPDLILSISGYGEYEQLASIAPTVQIDFADSGQWQSVAEAFGQAAGLEAEAAQLLADYEERLAMFADVVGDPAQIEVSVVRVAPDYISIYSVDHTSSFLGVILGDAGVAIPAQQAALAEETDFVGDISIEQLPLVNGDAVLIWTFATSDEVAANAAAALEDLRENPLWRTLPAVQNDAVAIVGGYWIGSSFHAAHAVIDDLFMFVAGVDASEAAPNPLIPASDESSGE